MYNVNFRYPYHILKTNPEHIEIICHKDVLNGNR